MDEEIEKKWADLTKEYVEDFPYGYFNLEAFLQDLLDFLYTEFDVNLWIIAAKEGDSLEELEYQFLYTSNDLQHDETRFIVIGGLEWLKQKLLEGETR